MKLSVRTYENKSHVVSGYVKGSADVYEQTKNDVGTSSREMFVIFYLNSKNGILSREVHSIGTIDSSAVYPREIIKAALLNDAVALVLVHNHPSGDPAPSQCDREITKEIQAAGKLFSVKVLDHVILGDGRFYSFADQGDLSLL
jgi:DNA repair protein RadC